MYSNRSGDPYADLALGLISAQSFPAIVGVADRMLKESSVTLVGYEQIGSGYCTAVVRGRTPDVRLAIEIGRELAAQFGQETTSIIIPRPMPNLEEVLPIGSRLANMVAGQENNKFRDQAVGLIETRGFPVLVAAADAMLKCADVTLSGYHKTGAGLCTAIVRGTMSNVAAAIEVGMVEADRVGELHAVMVIPRPMDDLERTLPIADCWIEQLQPIRMPLNVEVNVETETRQPLQPLELQPLDLPIAVPVELPIAIPLERTNLPPLRLEQPIEPESEPELEPELEPESEPDLMSIEPEILAPDPSEIDLSNLITIEPEPPEPQTIDIPVIEAKTLAIEAAPTELPLESPAELRAAPPAAPPAESPVELPEKRSALVILKPTNPKKGFEPDRPSPPHKP